MPAKLKVCSKCEIEKSITAFRRDRARLDGRQSFCKECARALQSTRYKEAYAKTRKVRDKKLRDEHRAKLDVIKAERGCKFCSENDPICLEFHHRDPETKNFSISSNTHRAWPLIEQEVAKCDVLCSNCHKKAHKLRTGFNGALVHTVRPHKIKF